MTIYKTYTVQAGDTLSAIAKDQGMAVKDLLVLNGIKNANLIVPGQQLKIAQISERYYTVQPGDTLGGIAKAYGVTVAALQAANQIADANRISPGQMIVLPGGAPAPSAVPKATAGPSLAGLGSLSSRYETSGRGPGTVSTGKNDKGGVSYGSYQLASAAGRPAEFLKAEGKIWAAKFAGHAQGTAGFSAAWKAIAAREPGAFQEAQHGYIRRTHYDVQMARVFKRTGVDLTKHSAAVCDVVWSTAVHHGPNTNVIVDALSKIGIKPDSPDFDKELIQAVYAQRGRRDPDGMLHHFRGNPRSTQESVAARFLSELKDALDMLTAERAREKILPIMASKVPDSPAAETDMDALIDKAAKSLTDDEVRLLLERFADDETMSDFIGGRKVVIALRKSTSSKQFLYGRYDDIMIVAWREPGGSVQLKRFLGNTEPAGEYAFDQHKAAKGSSVDADGDGRCDLGRLVPGTYHYVLQKGNFNGARYFVARDIQVTERDINHDGRFTVGSGDVINEEGAGRTMYIHRGGNEKTWSAGCQTIPLSDYPGFLALVSKQPSLSYVLINAD